MHHFGIKINSALTAKPLEPQGRGVEDELHKERLSDKCSKDLGFKSQLDPGLISFSLSQNNITSKPLCHVSDVLLYNYICKYVALLLHLYLGSTGC